MPAMEPRSKHWTRQAKNVHCQAAAAALPLDVIALILSFLPQLIVSGKHSQLDRLRASAVSRSFRAAALRLSGGLTLHAQGPDSAALQALVAAMVAWAHNKSVAGVLLGGKELSVSPLSAMHGLLRLTVLCPKVDWSGSGQLTALTQLVIKKQQRKDFQQQIQTKLELECASLTSLQLLKIKLSPPGKKGEMFEGDSEWLTGLIALRSLEANFPMASPHLALLPQLTALTLTAVSQGEVVETGWLSRNLVSLSLHAMRLRGGLGHLTGLKEASFRVCAFSPASEDLSGLTSLAKLALIPATGSSPHGFQHLPLLVKLLIMLAHLEQISPYLGACRNLITLEVGYPRESSIGPPEVAGLLKPPRLRVLKLYAVGSFKYLWIHSKEAVDLKAACDKRGVRLDKIGKVSYFLVRSENFSSENCTKCV